MIRPGEMSGATRGILLMLFITLLTAIMNVVARHVAATVNPYMIVFVRLLFGLLFISPFLLRQGISVFNTKRLGGHMTRAGFNVANMVFFFTAVGMTPLAELVALNFTAPVFATVLSVFLLRELVGIHRWAAILLGFAGAMVIVRPGFQALSEGHMHALLSALSWACVMLTVKSLSRTESSLTIVAYMAALMTPIALVPALFFWQTPTMHEIGWLAVMGAIGTAIHFLLAHAVREADLSVVMPFDFTKLIWISILGFLVFGEVPAWTTWIGGVLIFVSGSYIAHRETLRRI